MGPYNPNILQDDCTLSTCSLSQGQIHYQPTIAGNVTYLAIFGVLVVLQAGLGLWYRTWGFLIAFICGVVLEIVGYIGRIWMHSDPFTMSPFLVSTFRLSEFIALFGSLKSSTVSLVLSTAKPS